MQKHIYSSPSKLNSRNSTRPCSRGPGSDDENNELLNDINFGNLDEVISQRLNALLKLDSDESQIQGDKSHVKSKLHSVTEIVKTLEKSRNEVSTSDRELLLNQLYALIIKKPNLESEYDDYDYESDLLSMFKFSLNSRGSEELLLSVRSIVAFMACGLDNAGALYSEDKSTNVFEFLKQKISDSTIALDTRQHLVYAYTSLALLIHDESGGYGVDDMHSFLLETLIALTLDVPTNSHLIASLIYGIGSLLTVLVEHTNLNEIIENTLDSTVELLTDSDALEVVKPTSMLVGLCYEIYGYDDAPDDRFTDYVTDYDSLPYTNTFELTSRLEELIKTSSKRFSKKDKREGRSLFKDVLQTVNFYSEKVNRLNRMESINGENEEELILSHIKLSKSRSLAVKSWFAFFRLVQLKWVFSSGLHNQLANNPYLSKIIRDKPAPDYASKFNNRETEDDQEDAHWAGDSHEKRMSNKKKQMMLEKEREEKLQATINQTFGTD